MSESIIQDYSSEEEYVYDFSESIGTPDDYGLSRDRAVLESSLLDEPEATEKGLSLEQAFDATDSQENPNTNALRTKAEIEADALGKNRERRVESLGALINEAESTEDLELARDQGAEYLQQQPQTSTEALLENNSTGEVTREVIAYLTSQMKIQEDMEKTYAERGTLSTIDDWVDITVMGSFLTLDAGNYSTQHIENKFYKGMFGTDPEDKITGTHILDLATAYKNGDLSPEATEFIGNNLWRVAMEATDNNATAAARIANYFINDFTEQGQALIKSLEAIDMLGVAKLATSVIATVGAASLATLPQALAKVGATELALAVSKTASKKERYAAAANLEPEDIVDSVSPFSQVSKTNPKAADLAGEAATQAQLVPTQVIQSLVEVADDLLQATHLNTTRQNAFRAAWQDNKGKYIERLNAENSAVKDAEIIETGPDTFTVSVQYVNGGRARQEIYYAVDDLGTANVTKVGFLERMVGSATHLNDRWIKRIVEDSIVMREQSGRLREAFASEVRLAVEPLKKLKAINGVKPTDRVYAVLQAGDLHGGDVMTKISPVHGKVYTTQELEQGVETAIGTISLTAREIDSYQHMRRVMDTMHFIEQQTYLQKARSAGMKETVVSDVTKEGRGISKTVAGNVVPIGVVDDVDQILQPMADGTVRIISKNEAKNMPDSHVILRVPESNAIQIGDNLFDYISVAKSSLRQPTLASAPARQVGWFPRGQENVLEYLRVLAPGVKYNGRLASSLKDARGPQIRSIARTSSSKALKESIESGEVRELMRRHGLTEEQISKGQGKFWDVDTDKLSSGGIELNMNSRNTGLTRNRYPLYDVTGDTVMPAQTALASSISNVSAQFAQGRWLDVMQEKWLKTANKTDMLENPEQGFGSKLKDNPADFKGMPGPDIARALESQRGWLRNIASIPTQAQRDWQSHMYNMAKNLEGLEIFGKNVPTKNVRKVLMKIGHSNPTDSMRAAAFHAFLGVLNPAQLLVQASQFTIALSLNPTRAVSHLKKGMGIRVALNTYRSGGDISRAAKVAEMPVEEFKAMLRAYDRAGVEQGVKQTGDYAALRRGEPLTASRFSRLLDGGLIFFKEGEQFSRTYAFLNSGADFFERTGKTKWSQITDDDLLNVHAGMQQQTFMLDKNNRAYFQEGLAAIPTQFWQIASKSLERMGVFPGQSAAGIKFSAAERARIMAGQAVLFGAAGIPFADWFATHALNAMGAKPEEFDRETQALIGRGMTGFLQQYAFGFEFDIADRIAPIAAAEMLVENIAGPLAGDVPFNEVAFNAFGSLLGRGKETFDIMNMMWARPESDLSNVESRIEQDALYLKTLVISLATMISSVNNVEKAFMISKLGGIPGSKGQLLLDLQDDQVFSAMIGQGLGFAPLEAKFLYETMEANRQHSELKSKMADIILNAAVRDLKRYPNGGFNPQTFTDSVNLLLAGFSDIERANINKNLQTKIAGSKEYSVLMAAARRNAETGGEQRNLGPARMGSTSPYFNTLSNKGN